VTDVPLPVRQLGTGEQLLHQPRLADARLALHDGHCRRVRGGVQQELQLASAPDEHGRT
jgi:hypothetical protein